MSSVFIPLHTGTKVSQIQCLIFLQLFVFGWQAGEHIFAQYEASWQTSQAKYLGSVKSANRLC